MVNLILTTVSIIALIYNVLKLKNLLRPFEMESYENLPFGFRIRFGFMLLIILTISFVLICIVANWYLNA